MIIEIVLLILATILFACLLIFVGYIGINAFLLSLILVYWIGTTIYVFFPTDHIGGYFTSIMNRLLETTNIFAIYGSTIPIPLIFLWIIMGLMLILQPDFESMMNELVNFLGVD